MKKLLSFLFLISFSVFSQKHSLKVALEELSSKHAIDFSYNEELIKKYPSVSFNKETPLKTSLLSLQLQTQLVFEPIDASNYIVREKSKKTRSICGRVINEENRNGLASIAISFSDKTILTNEDGFFKIDKILKDEILTINDFEYQKKSVLVSDFEGECLEIKVQENINYLSEIIITDYLTKGFSKNKDGSIVLKPKEMGALPGVIEPDVLQTIQLIPGVQSPDETASGIHIRGSTPDQNLVLFDGMKMYHFSHFFGLISAFNPYITDDIKLYRSGTHAKYGNNVGGVLDIHTQKTIPEKLAFGLGSTLTHSDIYFKTPMFNKNVGLIVSARRSITDLVNTITFRKFSDVAFQNSRISETLESDELKIDKVSNNFFYEDYHAKLLVEPNEKSQFDFTYLYNLNDLEFSGEASRIQESFRDDITIKNKGFHLGWEYNISKKWNSIISLNYTKFDKLYEGNRIVNLRNNTEDRTDFNKHNYINENALSYYLENKIKEGQKLQLGIQYNKYDVFYNFSRFNALDTNSIDDSILNNAYDYAVFSEYELNKNNKWLFNLGLRWQHFNSVNENYLEPRLNVNYKLNKYLNLKLSSEIKHQSLGQLIDFRQDGLGGLFDRFWAIANGTDIPVLDSFQTSTGFGYQKKGWTIDAEIYYKFVDGVSYVMNQNLRNQKYFIGTNTVTGFDLLVKKKWEHYNTWISYSLSKSNYQFDRFNDGENFDGAFDAPHNFIWSHNYNLKSFEFSLGWRFRSGIPYTEKRKVENRRTGGFRLDFEDLNAKRLPNYQRLDFSAFYQFNSNKRMKGKIGLTLQNLTNKRNILSRDYDLESVVVSAIPNNPNNTSEEPVLVQSDKVSLGFVPNLVLRLSF